MLLSGLTPFSVTRTVSLKMSVILLPNADKDVEGHVRFDNGVIVGMKLRSASQSIPVE